MVVAGLQDGRDLAAVVVAVEPVITRTKVSFPVFSFFDGFDVALAAGRRARPVGVPLLYDGAGLDSTAELVKSFRSSYVCSGKLSRVEKEKQQHPS